MTPCGPPEFYVELKLVEQEYLKLIGDAYTAKILRPKRSHYIGCMVIVNELDEFEAAGFNSVADVWIDSKRSIIPLDTEVIFHFIESICYRLTDTEKLEAQKEKPIKVAGIIRKF